MCSESLLKLAKELKTELKATIVATIDSVCGILSGLKKCFIVYSTKP